MVCKSDSLNFSSLLQALGFHRIFTSNHVQSCLQNRHLPLLTLIPKKIAEFDGPVNPQKPAGMNYNVIFFLMSLLTSSHRSAKSYVPVPHKRTAAMEPQSTIEISDVSNVPTTSD